MSKIYIFFRNTLPSSRVRRAGSIHRRYWIMLLVFVAIIVLLLLSHRNVEDDNPFGSILDDDRRILQKN